MITSLENTKVKNWFKLHNKKYREDDFLLLDEELVKEAYKHNLLKTLIYTGDIPFEFKDAYEVSKDVLNKISKNLDINFIGVGIKFNEDIKYSDRIIILEDLQDPMNIGRIIESAYLFNFNSIIISENCADIYNQKCLNSAGKAFYNVSIRRTDINKEIENLKSLDYKIYATGLKSYSKEMYEVVPNKKMAFILGNEGSGVKEETMNISDEVVKIDMHNIDSLNVAMAGSIIMYHFNI